MSMLILPKLDTAGRLSPYILRRELVKHFRSLVVANTLQTNYVQDILASASPYFTPTGTVYMEHGLNGKGIRGDGTTGLLARNTSIPAQPLWMMAVFQCRTVSTPIKTITSLGAGDASTSYSFICSGNGTLPNIRGAVRGDTSGGAVNILGPVPEVSKLYSVVFSAPSNLLADGYLYVNGVKYTEPAPNAGNATFTNTWIYQAIGALKRNTTALFSDDFIYLTGYGLGEIPESLARDMSANPWSIFSSSKRFVYFEASASADVTANGVTLTASSGLIPGTATAAPDITANGKTLSASSSLIPGVAKTDILTSGKTFTVTSSIIAGNAKLDIAVPGKTFIVSSSIIPGTAKLDIRTNGVVLTSASVLEKGSASIPIQVIGKILNTTTTLLPGSATATLDTVVTGKVFQANSSLIAGIAKTDITIPGKTYTVASSLLPGTAKTDIKALGKTLATTPSLIPGTASVPANVVAPGAILVSASNFLPGTAKTDVKILGKTLISATILTIGQVIVTTSTDIPRNSTTSRSITSRTRSRSYGSI